MKVVAPNLASNEAALEALVEAVDKAGYKLGEEIQLALGAASSEFFDAEKGNTLLERVTDRNGIPMRWSTFTPTS